MLVTYTTGRTPRTVLDDIDRVLHGSHRTELNRLDGAVTDTQDTLTVEFDAGGIRAGSILEVEEEALYVWGVSTKTATVQRGFLGTTAAPHNDKSIVRVEPRFLRSEMLAAVHAEIRSWPTNVYARDVRDVTFPASVQSQELAGLTGDGVQLLHAYTQGPQGSRWYATPNVRLEARTAASGSNGYRLSVATPFSQATTLRLVLRIPLDPATLGPTDDFGTVGIPPVLVDVIPVGAAARLLMGREVPRTDPYAQGRSRPAEEVRVGDQLQVGRMLLQERTRLLNEAAMWFLAEDGMGWT